MRQEHTVTGTQLGALVFVFVFSTTIAFLIGPLAEHASFDGVWCILLGAAVGTAIVGGALRFAVRQPGSYIGDYGGSIVGQAVHRFILLFSAFFFLYLSAFILREFTDFFVPLYLRETPAVAVSILVMSAAAALAHSGVSAVFRFCQGVFIFIGGLFLIKPLLFATPLDSPMWHGFTRIHDAGALWEQTYALIPWYGELVMLAYIMPQFSTARHARRAVWIGAIAGTYILLSEFLLMMLFLGPKLSGAIMYPALELSGFLHLGDFVYNLDALIVSIWFAGLFIKLSIVFAIGTLFVSQALSVGDSRLITFPVAAFVVALSVVLARNPVELAKYFEGSWATFALFAEGLFFLYPLVSWARGLLGRRGGRSG
ncbi:GerAB/ArcD/ProY family transporter [Cohnella sp. 56]|uniref:GerAB/ArcD/ProY family transporter n=1 Tax=Cohnella sp. 56 TaxID=3113722 RepID=UPI0030EA6237